MPHPQAPTQTFGSWAVVTGASDGIGRAFAHALAANGYRLVLVARRANVLSDLAATLSSAFGIECRVISLDLTDADAVARLDAETASLDVGILVASAGFGSSGPLTEGNRQTERAMVAVNCAAVLDCAMTFGARFVARRGGALVLLSSIVAFQGTAHTVNYAATKAYVQSLAEGLRQELMPHGVRVLAVAPGPVRSGFASRAGMTMPRAASPETVARVALAALEVGGTVRPGLASKFLGWSLATAPRPLRVRIMSGIMHGMTKQA
jgi:uncharacterized protein